MACHQAIDFRHFVRGYDERNEQLKFPFVCHDPYSSWYGFQSGILPFASLEPQPLYIALPNDAAARPLISDPPRNLTELTQRDGRDRPLPSTLLHVHNERIPV